jgi:hypothetical protein
MSATDPTRDSRLDVTAAVRMILGGTDAPTVDNFLRSSEAPPLLLAHQACALAATLLAGLPDDTAAVVLEQLTRAAVTEE